MIINLNYVSSTAILIMAGIDIYYGTTINTVAATIPIFENKWQIDVLHYLR